MYKKILSAKAESTKPLRVKQNGRIILKCIIKKYGGFVWTGLSLNKDQLRAPVGTAMKLDVP
jgi:hypothetical protein